MAAVVHVDAKKKSSRHRDGGSGMSSATKRHFDEVKRKMFAFVDRQHRLEADGQHLAPPPQVHHRHHHHHPSPQPMFVDHNKLPKQQQQQQLHRRTPPAPVHKEFLTPSPPRRQVPSHLVLGTPQINRRIVK